MDLYFAYGSNMNFKQMALRCPGAKLGGKAYLPGWSYFINENGYAGIEQRAGAKVLGGLWHLKPKNWEELDRYEDIDQGFYEKVRIAVISENNSALQELEVWVYLSCNYKYGTPSAEYHEIVMEGARDLELSTDYVKTLEKWADGNNLNRNKR
jgi:gamma-glutamylcyclotransferase (GGCT)/AIG2-like uncharacterized protein YtfP